MFVKPNSLITAWKPEQQNTWRTLKEEAIQKVKRYVVKEKPSFVDLYRFLADARHQIAVTLQQESFEYMGILRDEKCDYIDTPITLLHPDHGRYESFFPCLAYRYQALSQSLPLNSESLGLAYLLLGAKQEQDIQSVNYLNLEYDALQLTSFYTVSGSAEQKPISWYALVHTPRTQLKALFERLECLYQQLDSDSASKDKRLKEMIWYLAHAMPCVRGSAAILEMMIPILCEKFAIPFDYPPTAVPIDLIALFTPSPEAFVADFSLTPLTDLKNELRQLLREGKNSPFFCSQNPELTGVRKLLNAMNGLPLDLTSQEIHHMNTRGSKLNDIIQRYQFNGILSSIASSPDQHVQCQCP